MENQENKIKKLYAAGILTKEEMDAELAKLHRPSQSAAKSHSKWKFPLILATVCLAVLGIICLVVNGNTHKSEEVAVSPMDGTESPVEKATWAKTTINGQQAIVTKFHHPQHGILEVAYSPSTGLRFGWFDANNNPKEMLPGSFMTYPVACTQQMVDEGRAMPEMLGEELMYIIQTTNREGNFIYCDDQEIVKAFLNHVSEGTVTWLQLSQFVENGNAPSASDYGGEYLHYLWGTNFTPGEITKAISKL